MRLHALTLPALLVCLAAVGPAPAGPHEVRDQAELFRPDTVAKADEVIRDIKSTYHQDVLIETYAELPADLREKSKLKQWFGSGPDQAQVARWAEERARGQGVAGIYVFVCKKPERLHVYVSPETEAKAFTKKDRETLQQRLRDGLKPNQDHDATLLAATSFVRSTMATNLVPPAGGATESFEWWWLLVIAVGLLGAWVVFGVLRAFLGRGRPVGGAVPGLLGGMFGAAAGGWLTQTVLRRAEAPAEPRAEPGQEQ
jgi:hypothetical protein